MTSLTATPLRPASRAFSGPFLSGVRRMARDVERRWRERGYNWRCFDRLATDALQRARLHEKYSSQQLFDWLAKAKGVPAQMDLGASFGSPPITLWAGDRFVVDVYFWPTVAPSIHDHGFCGAYTVLHGCSLQTRHAFRTQMRRTASFQVGELVVEGADYLRPGAVQTIRPGRRLIHATWHLDRPTVTLIVRSKGLGKTFREFTYEPSGVAIQVRRAAHERRPSHQAFVRVVQVAHMLAAVDDERAATFLLDRLPHRDAWQSWHLLNLIHELCDASSNEDVLAAGMAVQTAIPQAHASAVRTAIVTRRHNSEHVVPVASSSCARLLLGLLSTFDAAAPIMRVLGDAFPAEPAAMVVERGVEEMQRLGMQKHVFNPLQLRIVALIAGGSDHEAIVERLVADNAIDRSHAALLPRFYGLLARVEWLAPLVVGQPALHAAEQVVSSHERGQVPPRADCRESN